MTRIGIAGITGRMGHLLAAAATKAATLSGGISRTGSLADLARASDVVVDFTVADTVIPHAAILAEAGRPWVLGTTGLTAADQAAVEQAAQRIPIVQAANFATGVNLLLALVERLAAALPPETFDAEVLEMHHRQKIDAPSGTALALGKAVADGRTLSLDQVRRLNPSGPRANGEIGFASLRGGQIVGEHSVLFTSANEQITLTHRALDRALFAEGAIRAALWLTDRPPGLYAMQNVLSL